MTGDAASGGCDDRHSDAGEPDLIADPNQRIVVEARNALRQFDVGMEIVEQWLQAAPDFRLRISHLLILNRVVLEGLNRYAGTFRSTPIQISGSNHKPPDPPKCQFLLRIFVNT